MADSFSLEDFGGAGDNAAAPPPPPKTGMTLDDFSPTLPDMDNSDQVLRSIEHGATFGLSEKSDARQTPEAIARFERFKSEHPWLNAGGNIVGGGLLASGLPLVAAALPETGLMAGITGPLSEAAAPALNYMKDATAGLDNFVNPLVNAGKSSAIGAGWGGAYGLGDSSIGHRLHDTWEGIKSGAEFGPLAELGSETVLGVGGSLRKLVEPFYSPMTTARRVFSGMFPGTEIGPIPAGVPGYKPTMGQVTGNPNIQAFERQALPGTSAPGAENLATRLDEQGDALNAHAASMAPGAQPGLAVNEIRSNVNDEIAAYQQRAQDEAVKARTALEGASGHSEHGLAGLTPQDASTTARAQLDGIQQYYRDKEGAAWDRLDAPNLTVQTMGRFKNGVGDYYASLPPYARGVDNNPELESLYETVKGLDKNVPFDQIQQIRSDALKMARGMKLNNPVKADALNGFADAIHTSTEDINGLTPESKQAWVDARAATKDRHERFGDSLIGKYIGDNADTAARSPSMTLQNILTGPGAADKFSAMLKAVTPEGGVPNAGVVNSVKQYIASDIADKLGTDIVNPKAVQTALLKYRPVIDQHPDLKTAFGSVSDAQDSAFTARQLADQRTDAIQKSAAYKFMGADPGDPNSINNAVGGILANKNPMQTAQQIAARMKGDPDALNGMRRVFVDKMMDDSTTPHEFIDNNRSALDVFFPDKQHQTMLDNIADASRMSEASSSARGVPNEAWKNLNSDHSYLGALVGKGTAAGAQIVGGGLGAGAGALAAHAGIGPEFLGEMKGPIGEGFGAAAGIYGTKKLLNSIYAAPREKVVQIIKNGLLDPNGVGRALTKTVSEINSKDVWKYIIPGVASTVAPDNGKPSAAASSLGYAKGGKVKGESKTARTALAKSHALLRKATAPLPTIAGIS